MTTDIHKGHQGNQPLAFGSTEGLGPLLDSEENPARLWAEIHRLRAAVKGPQGYETWQDAAITERVRRVRAASSERERCANVCEAEADGAWGGKPWQQKRAAAKRCAELIRGAEYQSGFVPGDPSLAQLCRRFDGWTGPEVSGAVKAV